MNRTSLLLSSLLSGLFVLTVSFQPMEKKAENKAPKFVEGPIRTLIIDPGHGGRDPGSVGKHHYEKDIALKVSLQLKRILAQKMPRLKVILTREDDVFVPLKKRGEIALNNGGDFFMSIHCNGLEKKTTFGTETYVLGVNKGQDNYERIINENQSILFEENYEQVYGGFDPSSPEADILMSLTSEALRQESLRMAEKVQFQYKNRLKRYSRGVKQAPFVVLYMCGMPSILTEIGFITNEDEEKFLGSVAGQVYVASALYRAIKEYNLEFME